MTGKLILVLGPSGSGKSSLIAHIRSTYSDIVFPVSCTTRELRPGEKNGAVYHFLSAHEFQDKINRSEFLEWARYGGNLYGTLKSEILPAFERGRLVIREVEAQGARSILALLPKGNVVIVFVDAGPWEALERRILARAPMSAEELEKRRKRYEEDISFRTEASYVVQNPEGALPDAKRQFEDIIRSLKGV
jgi:guanylate kinase